MSDQNPYEKLGVKENASFEEIQDAKKRLSQQYKDDNKIVESIDAAYDAIIMDRLRMRQEGKIKVPERIRFPEKLSQAPSNPNPVSLSNSPPWLQQLIDTPSQTDILWPAGVFLVLAVITVFGDPSLSSLLIALGIFANVYFLNRKEHRFLRSLLITLIGFIGGFALGVGIANIFVSQNIGIPSVGREQFASLVTFCIFWLISSFLR